MIELAAVIACLFAGLFAAVVLALGAELLRARSRFFGPATHPFGRDRSGDPVAPLVDSAPDFSAAVDDLLASIPRKSLS